MSPNNKRLYHTESYAYWKQNLDWNFPLIIGYNENYIIEFKRDYYLNTK